MAQIDLKNAVITFIEGGAATLEIKIGEGNLTYSEKRNVQYVKDRGELDYTRLGDEEPVDVSLDFVWEFLKGDTAGAGDVLITPEDFLKFRGGASAYVTTDPDPCAPACIDIKITYSVPCATIKDETILLKYFRYENLNHDLKAGSVSITGKCNVVEAEVTRVAQ
jgi:hypothetical protein